MKLCLTLALLASLTSGVLLAANRQRPSDTLAAPGAHPGAAASAARLASDTGTAGEVLEGAGGTLQDLGLLADRVSRGMGLNDAGEVVGQGRTGLGTGHAFHSRAGVMADLGPISEESASGACGINGSGQIVGWAHLGDTARRAFLVQAGVMEDLGTLGGVNSAALAINGSGQIVGWASLPEGAGHAFLCSRGVMKDLGTLGGDYSVGCAIDDAGQIMGSGLFHGRRHAFLWTPHLQPSA